MIEFLENLPSRGALQTSNGSLVGRSAVNYVCNHETDPPGGQVISTDEPCILATCLQKARQKDVENKKKQKAAKAADQSKKRKEEQPAASAGPSKKLATEHKAYTAQQLRPKQNQELVEICRSLGLPVSGKKDILVERIVQSQAAKENR